MVAIIRPSEWEWPLLIHLLGAFVLVGALAVAVAATALGRRSNDEATWGLRKIAFRTLLFAGLPSFVAFRVAAEWLYSKEEGQLFPKGEDPAWVGIGYIVSDAGALLLLILIVLSWLSSRKRAADGGSRLTTAVLALSSIYLAALAVAWWAMTVKPD